MNRETPDKSEEQERGGGIFQRYQDQLRRAAEAGLHARLNEGDDAVAELGQAGLQQRDVDVFGAPKVAGGAESAGGTANLGVMGRDLTSCA
eukprot:CAMPEP_0178992318 /NCGR_PEP_ID=MMETSP0795-20121207/6043_1 /TAXON_ID=88552 /ORGANISM="Amoebophrya sp., Strain Ameob2" /LENGTH=90 /DNA_ID=CAMNT_0020684177 /DNA_START=748 /DNA_END=1021 /DNA_ORIENTATION=+